MTDYNAEEMARMQKEAMERVVEMKNRSRAYTGRVNQSSDILKNTEKPVVGNENQNENPDRNKTDHKMDTEPSDTDYNSAHQEDQMETLFLICLFLLLKEENNDSIMPLLVLFML